MLKKLIELERKEQLEWNKWYQSRHNNLEQGHPLSEVKKSVDERVRLLQSRAEALSKQLKEKYEKEW